MCLAGINHDLSQTSVPSGKGRQPVQTFGEMLLAFDHTAVPEWASALCIDCIFRFCRFAAPVMSVDWRDSQIELHRKLLTEYLADLAVKEFDEDTGLSNRALAEGAQRTLNDLAVVRTYPLFTEDHFTLWVRREFYAAIKRVKRGAELYRCEHHRSHSRISFTGRCTNWADHVREGHWVCNNCIADVLERDIYTNGRRKYFRAKSYDWGPGTETPKVGFFVYGEDPEAIRKQLLSRLPRLWATQLGLTKRGHP